MKKSFSRLLSFVLAVLMLASVVPAFAVNAESGDGWLEVPAFKNVYKKYFDIGNIISPEFLEGRDGVSGEEIQNVLKYHYNIITGENDMKPISLSSAKGVYNFTKADKMVDWALENDIAVHGHTLVWHGQSPRWLNLIGTSGNTPLTRAEAKANMKEYIDTVAGHYAGKIVSWDVVNEAFGGSAWNANLGWQNSLRKTSPWYLAYANGMDAEAGETAGDYIYDAFVFARLADPNAVLYINDFNDHLNPNRSAIPAMAKELNEQWKDDPRNTDIDRPLIEGVGMQAHYWSQEVNSLINNVRTALNAYSAAGLKIIVSELDIPASSSYSPKTATATDIANQTKMYGELFTLFQQYDAIERVTFWGMKDNWSWRGGTDGDAQPLPFDKDGKVKDSYYSIVNAYVAPPLVASELKLTSDKAFIGKDEYLNVSAVLDPKQESNAAALTLAFDAEKLQYRGFTAADGITLINTDNDGNGKVTLTIGDLYGYDLSDLGAILFSVAEDIELEEDETSVINAKIDYVVLDEGEKSILSAAASLEAGIVIDKEFTLIDLSNIIDLFGVKVGNELWSKAKYFDYNNNGEIDVSDISHVASLIK